MTEQSKTDEIMEELKKRILQGYYISGQRLPSERELAEEFKVSRPTVRNVFLRLQATNLIDIVPQSGSFVRPVLPKVDPSLSIHKGPELQTVGSFFWQMQQQGRQVQERLLQPSVIVPMGNELATKLQMSPDVDVLRRYRVQLVDRVPYRILDSYYIAEYFRDILSYDTKHYQKPDYRYIHLFKWLRRTHGIKATKCFEKFNCRMPSVEEASILHISRIQPVVDVERWVWGRKENSDEEFRFEYTHFIANAALHEFTSAYEISDEATQWVDDSVIKQDGSY